MNSGPLVRGYRLPDESSSQPAAAFVTGWHIARNDSGQGDLRERMAHLEGLREAITRTHAA